MFWSRNFPMAPRATLSNPLDLFNRFFSAPGHHAASVSAPAFNIWADEESAVVTSELPGVQLADVDITVSGNTVAVKGGRQSGELGEKDHRVRQERPAGQFERSFRLGFQIDASRVEARLVNGILEITLPRAENDKPRKINISSD